MDLKESLYVSSSEAAAILNVSVSTLYTYVSRKSIRAHKGRGERTSRYLRSDIEQLAMRAGLRTEREPSPGVVSSSTAISMVTEGGSYFRGVSVIDLADSASFEDVCRLLWGESDVDPFSAGIPAAFDSLEVLPDAAAACNGVDRLYMLLPLMELANPLAHDLSRAGLQRSSVDLLRHAFMLGFGAPLPAKMPLHRYVASATRCGRKFEDLVRRVLVLAADMSIDPSAYAVRAVANTGATPYRCIAAGLCAVSGRRLPSVRTTSFQRFIQEIDAASDPLEPVRSRFHESESLPGFSYAPFQLRDPRAIALLLRARELLSADRRFARFDRALRLGGELTGGHPEFAFVAAYINFRVGVDAHMTLIRLSRLAGWTAHAMEQQLGSSLEWLRVRYRGVLPK